MSEITSTNQSDVKLQQLKTTTSLVYLCQVLTFLFAGLPLLIGVVINIIKRDDVSGTWLESHFNWQIKTVWVTLAGFALAGLTLSIGIGLYILFPTLGFLVYRIAVGWTALTANKPIKEEN
ncbi:hypothetical protein MCAMS1_00613 [biofilm metagenome]